jgi:hypothetical protein
VCKIGSTEILQKEPVTGAAGDEQEDVEFRLKLKERKYRIEKDVVRTQQHVELEAGLEKEIDSETVHLDCGRLIEAQPHLSMLRNILMSKLIFL